MAACSTLPSSLYCLSRPPWSSKARRNLQVKAQNFRDEGRSMNIVDANLSVLRKRVEEVMMKERCCKSQEYGWYYQYGYDHHHKVKRDNMNSSELLNLVGLIGGSLGLPILSGTLFLCIISFVVHITQ